jgi:high-affinity K+ transport system ATPase subunit B
MSKLRAVLHFDRYGNATILADGGVEVYCIDENAPDDRVYRMRDADDRGQIDALIGDGPISHADDDCIEQAVSKPRLTLVRNRP